MYGRFQGNGGCGSYRRCCRVQTERPQHPVGFNGKRRKIDGVDLLRLARADRQRQFLTGLNGQMFAALLVAHQPHERDLEGIRCPRMLVVHLDHDVTRRRVIEIQQPQIVSLHQLVRQ